MCGIFCEISCTECTVIKDDEILQRIKNRGPNSVQTIEIKTDLRIVFCGAVLWMQGPDITLQPVENENGILLFNGDIFDENWNISFSDTQILMDKLSNKTNSSEEIIGILKSLKGPFSILFYNKLTHNLYFTRDRIGRNTILFHKSEKSIAISSTLGRKYKCVEVPATHIHILNVKSNRIKFYSWNDKTISPNESSVEDWLKSLEIQQRLPDDEFVLKSENYTLDLSDNDNVVKHIETVAKETNCKLTVMVKLMEHATIKNTIVKITELLEKSVEIRIKKQPNKCKNCIYNRVSTCDHCVVGVLFSGGLDCTILALLADKYLPQEQSIDLINVAFKKDINASYDVPDRITGRQSLEELRTLCPSRKWVFREINVPKEELEEFQATTIADLVYPRQTILDESLGSALWFAARGKDDNMISTCRVLLLGSGADELFGGYIRHRNAFKRHGWTGLEAELQLDWNRISFRNLARDNRVICDHGRQPRMPYLDDDLSEYVLQLKPWLKCFPSENLGPGIGDKLMLRLVALNLGLKEVVQLPKRALQFGSKIANKKEKGSDLSKTFICSD